ncbi:hypothetical protein [Nitrosospira multiformis]|uniref:hypothetical protein n=1 Tax=Nitrosospira multiformis TaxID=1231 RepID=UPI00142EE381|nr:hypothetical protein [Nitrosospira multiformis]
MIRTRAMRVQADNLHGNDARRLGKGSQMATGAWARDLAEPEGGTLKCSGAQSN